MYPTAHIHVSQKLVYSCHDSHGTQTLDTYFNSIIN